ncbi:MAG: hypothetical protein ACPL3C_09945 [Pyrobaculum sp.]
MASEEVLRYVLGIGILGVLVGGGFLLGYLVSYLSVRSVEDINRQMKWWVSFAIWGFVLALIGAMLGGPLTYISAIFSFAGVFFIGLGIGGITGSMVRHIQLVAKLLSK